VSPRVEGLLEEGHALMPQLGRPGIEVGDTERDVLLQLTAGRAARQRPFLSDGRDEPGAHRGIEVCLVSVQGGEGIVLPQMHMVEAFGGVVANIFDQCALRPVHVGETAAARGLDVGGLGLLDLCLGQPGALPLGAGQVSLLIRTEPPASMGVERPQRNVLPIAIGCDVGAYVGDVPADVPDGTGGRHVRRRGDLVEQDHDVVRRQQRLVSAPDARGRAGELSRVEPYGGIGVDGVHMQMMEVGGREHAGIS
jgi:hypothetical protein